MPTTIRKGERIGREGRIRAGCSATIFDNRREKVLLTRRTDNGLWCLPGGGLDPGESAAECCEREVFEETGLRGRVTRLIGVYSSPDWLVEYQDGNRAQIVALNFEVALDPESADGALEVNSEVSQFGYFRLEEIQGLELMINHRQRIIDAFANQAEAFIR
jgi:8-oxo-dGTP pyrophosphatase MutT (NUDIX family)